MTDPRERAAAIVGLAAILPDAPSARAFRDNVWSGRYSIREVPAGRWSVADYYDPDPAAPDKTYSKIGAWVRDFTFDWKRFHIPPRVAAAMDEGQQWAVTIAADALADFGYPERPLDLEGVTIVPLKTTARFQWRLNWSKGHVSTRALQEALALVEAAPAGHRILVACHHPLVEAGTRSTSRTRGSARSVSESARRPRSTTASVAVLPSGSSTSIRTGIT